MQVIQLGESHKIEIPNGAILNKVPPVDNRPTFTILNESVKINGVPATAYNGRYTAEPLDSIELSGELHDSNGELVPLTIPITLKMPFVRYASGKPTDDEVYLNATLTNGVFTCTGVIPRSGAWYATTVRNNQALNEINAQFQLSAPDAIFLA